MRESAFLSAAAAEPLARISLFVNTLPPALLRLRSRCARAARANHFQGDLLTTTQSHYVNNTAHRGCDFQIVTVKTRTLAVNSALRKRLKLTKCRFLFMAVYFTV